jgi:hypothetical protein
MLLQPPPLPTGTCKTTTRPTKINLQPGKVTVTNHYFTISTAQPSYCFKKMMLKEVICTFCTTSSNGAEGKKVTKGNKANHNKRQMNQLCPFATRTVHAWWNRLPATHSSTNCNWQNRDKYSTHSGFITHKISIYFVEPLVQISSKKLQVNSAHIRCKPGLSFTFINSTKQLV